MTTFYIGFGFYSTTTTGSGLITISSFFGYAFMGDLGYAFFSCAGGD